VARSAAAADAFQAVAEPHRRQIIKLLASGERSVNDVARTLQVRQPQASKHLRVLRKVGLVQVRGAGPQRFYSLNGAALKPIHDWVSDFERLWSDRLDRLADYLAELQAQEKTDDSQ
jgi:DNA-binding transcriptional ArsR family regulator